jgi:hypothetical protein
VASPDFASVADRVFRAFMAPLVLGGAMVPGKPIGARVALAIGEQRVAGDPDLASHVTLARVRVARKLVPIDRLEPASPAEWALACALHDIVQSTHPGFDGAFRRRSATRLLDLVDATLERTAPIADLRDALSRHTWLSRLFEIRRTDTSVSWWVGRTNFLGTEPPARLTAWPELRRVTVERTPHTLLEFPAHGASVDVARLGASLARLLARSPLTDLATCARAAPIFAWTTGTLGFVAAPRGRTVAVRALARERASSVDAALGRATRALLAQKSWRAFHIAMELLAERTLGAALVATAAGKTSSSSSDGAFARAAGAIAAMAQITSGLVALTEKDKRRLVSILEPIASSSPAREIAAALAASA